MGAGRPDGEQPCAAHALDWVKARPGHKHLVLGNHDPAHPMYSDCHKWERSTTGVRQRWGGPARKIRLPGGTVERVLMSHFPYHGDRTEYMDRPPSSGCATRGCRYCTGTSTPGTV